MHTFFSEIRGPKSPIVYPTKIIDLEPDFSGEWIVAGDIDGDGELEFVTARNHYQSVTALSAYKIDGTLLWKWGKGGAGESRLGYDVPVQIYDINGDGNNEVLLSERGFFVVLDGHNGKELNRFRLPKGLPVADCITFANIRGKSRATDIIIKDRYTRLWAYTPDWEEIWSWAPKYKWGYKGMPKTCHHPTPVDVDCDGRDEIMAGYTMIDDDGTDMWTFSSEKFHFSQGHLDCCRVVQKGKKPEEFRFVLTCCAAHLIALIDGTGNTIWEIGDNHFQSCDVGRMLPGSERKQIFVDVGENPYGPGWLIDVSGIHIGTYVTNDMRYHGLVDWNGDGLDEIVLAQVLTMVDGLGNRIVSFGFDRAAKAKHSEQSILVKIIDVTNNGVGDVVLHTGTNIYIYRNPSQLKKKEAISDTVNFTLY